MTATQILQDLLYAVITAALPILASYLVKFVQTKAAEIQAGITDTKRKALLVTVTQMISDAVTQTNQTFVDSLKASGKWTDTTAKQAFEQTKTTVTKLLTADAKALLAALYGDADAWLDTKIEALVKTLKSESAASAEKPTEEAAK